MSFAWFKKNKNKQDPDQKTSESTEPLPAKDKTLNEALEKKTNLLPAESEKEISDQPASIDQKTVQTGPVEPTGLFKRLKNGLSKTRKFLSTDINELFAGKRKIDDELLDELEELLITSDIGVQTTMDLIQSISKKSSEIA